MCTSLFTPSYTDLYHPLYFYNDTPSTQIYTLSLHDALPISGYAFNDDYNGVQQDGFARMQMTIRNGRRERSEEHTSELQSLTNLVCRLLLEKKKDNIKESTILNIE